MEILPSTVTSALVILGVLAFVAGSGMGEDENCSKSEIQISQSPTTPLPSGIPAYTVEIANTCTGGCNIYNIHVACGMFSSAIVINPKVFKRLSYNDCLVNDGKTLPSGNILSFKYANSFPYPLSVSSVTCG